MINIPTCKTCKAFGAQGMYYRQEIGDRRYCAIALFEDWPKELAPGPEWKITWGDIGASKGCITVHKDFGCINHDATFDRQEEPHVTE